MVSAFDIQVNGYAGFDFNDPDVPPEDFRTAAVALCEDGCAQVLISVVTAEPARMIAVLENIRYACESDSLVSAVVAGVHMEGPFISPEPGFVGAHPVEHVKSADLRLAKRLLKAGDGLIKLVTLAPEQDKRLGVTKLCVDNGIVVSAGHTDATTDQLRASIDAGLSMFTHLGNGCPTEMHRHDNIIQRALALSDEIWISLIPDGQHVPTAALRNFYRAAGAGRCIFTTDAMAGAAAEPGTHSLAHLKIKVGKDGVARLPGSDLLAGSTTTMAKIHEFATEELGLSPEEITAAITDNPKAALGFE